MAWRPCLVYRFEPEGTRDRRGARGNEQRQRVGPRWRGPAMDEVERLSRRQSAAAKEAEEEGVWITYLIRDPRRVDLKGNQAGWPIYVGQTDQFGRRVRNHLRKSEKLARAGTGIKAR